MDAIEDQIAIANPPKYRFDRSILGFETDWKWWTPRWTYVSEPIANDIWCAGSRAYPKLLSGVPVPSAQSPLTRHMAGEILWFELPHGLYVESIRCPPLEIQNTEVVPVFWTGR